MPYSKGHKKIGGRDKGSTNINTRLVKEVFSDVFHNLQEDPIANLATWGKKNPTEFYKIAARLIPTEIQGNISGKIIQVSYTNGITTDSYTIKDD